MTEEILSQYYPKYNPQAAILKDILRDGLEQAFVGKFKNNNDQINISEFKLRHHFDKKDNDHLLDQIKKKLKLNNQKAEMRCVNTIQNIRVETDLNYDPKYFQENTFYMNQNLDAIKQKIIEKNVAERVKKAQEFKSMQKALNIWFQQSQQQKNEDQNKQQQQTNKKQMNSSSQIIVKQHQTEGIQVSGIITTRQGYKMTYPNLAYIIKATDIPERETQCSFVKKIRPLQQLDFDQLDDLRRYVWKYKQYTQFFKILLKVAQGNLEISETLVKTQQRMKTGFYHVMTFYHISNRSWAICRLIKDLNKKGLYQRERQNLYETMLENIQEDLEEIFSPLLFESDYVPVEEQFISFEQYKKRLQEVILMRENGA
ncbi:unnamed protein product [Paramecium octaurelia]|uniref:Uncharacterized protein n=1 Tax=Paramecium octaurelia TaxID=43137 RepID=A0A8S1WBX1_PAROT|nr:unnamed protein product [Paramecium octaurelia]